MTETTDPKTAPYPNPKVLGGVVPYLTVDGARKAAEFYRKAFGAELVYAYPDDDKGRTMHVHLYVNGSSIMLSDAFPEYGHPLTAPQSFALNVIVDDIDAWWERAVEEAVGPVIRRLSRKVDTTGLIKLTVLTDGDCTAMRLAFGRCSALLHSQPGELNPRLPEPTAIEAEIDALEKWIADIRARQEKAA